MIVTDNLVNGDENYVHANETVDDSLKKFVKAYFKLRSSGGMMQTIDSGSRTKINDLMFLAFLGAHNLDLEQFNKLKNTNREILSRQFVAWRAIMEAYVGFGYLNPSKAMEIDIMDMIVHTDTEGKVIQTLGLLPAREGNLNLDEDDLGLPTLALYDIPAELQEKIDSVVANGKRIVELGRFARSGTINYVRSKIGQSIDSDDPVTEDMFPSWKTEKLNQREKVFYNLRLIISALKVMKDLGADSLIANIADQGTIFINNAQGEEIAIDLKGAGEFFEPIVEMLGGGFYNATWKEDQREGGPFSKYAKGHPNIRIAFIPQINYARVGMVLLSKFSDFFRDKKNGRELADVQRVSGHLHEQ